MGGSCRDATKGSVNRGNGEGTGCRILRVAKSNRGITVLVSSRVNVYVARCYLGSAPQLCARIDEVIISLRPSQYARPLYTALTKCYRRIVSPYFPCCTRALRVYITLHRT